MGFEPGTIRKSKKLPGGKVRASIRLQAEVGFSPYVVLVCQILSLQWATQPSHNPSELAICKPTRLTIWVVTAVNNGWAHSADNVIRSLEKIRTLGRKALRLRLGSKLR